MVAEDPLKNRSHAFQGFLDVKIGKYTSNALWPLRLCIRKDKYIRLLENISLTNSNLTLYVPGRIRTCDDNWKMNLKCTLNLSSTVWPKSLVQFL